MLDMISKRIAYRNAPLHRFGFNTRTVAGITGLVAIGAAALAVLKRLNGGTADVGLLSVNGPGPDTPQDPTRDELYEMARERDIHGRSSMNKAELKDALDVG
jgi:hypothetical protein